MIESVSLDTVRIGTPPQAAYTATPSGAAKAFARPLRDSLGENFSWTRDGRVEGEDTRYGQKAAGDRNAGQVDGGFSGFVPGQRQGKDVASDAPAGSASSAFLAQQIAQEVLTNGHVPPRAANAARYQIPSLARMTVFGPQISVDIRV